MTPKVSVQWAASIASVFWGVWWTSFVKDIAVSQTASIIILGAVIPKTVILIILVLWGVLFAIIFVRWLARVQHWGWDTGIGSWISNSRSLATLIGILIVGLKALPTQFQISSELVAYGVAIAVLWPIAPFIVAIWPEERR
jgi:hypothetical protein